MKKLVVLVSICLLFQIMPFIGWWVNLQIFNVEKQLSLPATVISQQDHIRIIKANKKENIQKKKDKLILDSFENMITNLEEEPNVKGKTETSQLGLMMMNMAGTILISDETT